jgi:hypothetical protein
MCYYTDARCTINSFQYKCERENLHPLHLKTLMPPSLWIERGGGAGGGGKEQIPYIFFNFKLIFNNKNYSIFNIYQT